MITPDVQAEATHAVGDHVTGSDASFCDRHRGQPGGTVTAVDGGEWARVSYPDGSYCEGPAVAFTRSNCGAHCRRPAVESGAAERHVEQPPALVLPDGWAGSGEGLYRSDFDAATSPVYASTVGVETCGINFTPTDARALAARLVEAAGIVEQIRAGAR